VGRVVGVLVGLALESSRRSHQRGQYCVSHVRQLRFDRRLVFRQLACEVRDLRTNQCPDPDYDDQSKEDGCNNRGDPRDIDPPHDIDERCQDKRQ
jgi:hypothetical protein